MRSALRRRKKSEKRESGSSRSSAQTPASRRVSRVRGGRKKSRARALRSRGSARPAKFCQRDALDLADALAREPEAAGELVVGRRGGLIQAEVAADDVALAVVQPLQQLADLFAGEEALGGGVGAAVGNVQRRLFFRGAADGETGRPLGEHLRDAAGEALHQ